MNQSLTGIDALFSQTWQLVKSEWKATLKWTVGMVVVEYAIQFLNTWYRLTHTDQRGLYLVGSSLVFLFVVLFFSVGLMKHMADKVVPNASRPPLGHIFGYSLVTTLLMIPLLAFGFVLFIIPGIWLAVSLEFVVFFLMENKSPIEALRASMDLVKGRWWAVFGRNIMAGLIMLAVGIAVGFVMIGLTLGLVIIGIGSIVATGLQPEAFLQSILLHPGQSAVALVAILISGLIFLAISLAHRAFSMLFMSAYHVLLFKSLKEHPLKIAESTPPTSNPPAAA